MRERRERFREAAHVVDHADSQRLIAIAERQLVPGERRDVEAGEAADVFRESYMPPPMFSQRKKRMRTR